MPVTTTFGIKKDNRSPETKFIIRQRKNLHYAIRDKVKEIGFLDTDAIVEKVKRSFLWYVCGVETSKSLNLDGLKKAKLLLRNYSLNNCADNIQKMYGDFLHKDYLKLSSKQRNKLVAVMRYSLKMSNESIYKYVEDTIGRNDWIGHLTVSEANELIRRVEKWEAKKLTGRNL